MKSIREYFPKSVRKRMRQSLGPAIERLNAVKSSLRFDAKEFASQQFIRFAYYSELKRWIARGLCPSRSRARVIEFGGSNNIIPRMFCDVDYVIASNWPEVDIQNLKQYSSEAFDVVVIDQVLEHVPDPHKAVSEIWRVLKREGICLCATPFLIKIHDRMEIDGSYGDYWRFTELGLKTLFSRFSSVEVSSWGNRFTLETTIRHGWLDCAATKRRLRVALWNEPEWPLVYLTKAVK